MSALQLLSLVSIALGVVAVLRFVWLDSLRFADHVDDPVDSALVSPQPVRGLAAQAGTTRGLGDTQSLPRAA